MEPDPEKLNIQKEFTLSDFDMEFLCSAKQYKKYIAKTKPLLLVEKQKEIDHFAQYKSRIQRLFQNLMNQYEDVNMSSSDLAPLEIQDIFKTFVQKSIHHFEMMDIQEKSLEKSCEQDDEDDDESMFGHIESSGSCWGKKITKSETPFVDMKSWIKKSRENNQK